MSGNNNMLRRFFLTSIALLTLLGLAANADAYQRAIPAKNFRVGLNIEPGFQFMNFAAFSQSYGLLLKFNEKVSFIPTYSYAIGSEFLMDFGLGIRVEYPKEVILQSTQYEYDVERQEFVHHYYYNTWRPFIQFQAGSYLGFGAGVLGYISSSVAMGFGGDMGFSFIGETFSFTVPKIFITMGF
jgi:hypothetical protein